MGFVQSSLPVKARVARRAAPSAAPVLVTRAVAVQVNGSLVQYSSQAMPS